MNKFGNTVTSARRQLEMYLFMYVSDVVALNDSASPTDSYCYFNKLLAKRMHKAFTKFMELKDGITSPGGSGPTGPWFKWNLPDLVAVNRKSTAFPQVMRMFGAPSSLTIEMEDRRMKSWKHTIAFGTLTYSTTFKSYAVYEMEDGMILRLDTLTGVGRWTIPATLYVFDKKHLSSEQISGLSSVTPDIFQFASGGSA